MAWAWAWMRRKRLAERAFLLQHPEISAALVRQFGVAAGSAGPN